MYLIAGISFSINPLVVGFKDIATEYWTCDISSSYCEISIDSFDLYLEYKLYLTSLNSRGYAPYELSKSSLELSVIHRKISEHLITKDVLLMHGSVVSVDGIAYMFTAESGTGKSTHTSLWRQLFGEMAVMVNDDKPFIAIPETGDVLAYGSPWCGKHHIGNNISVPLKAICWLERDDTNHIRKISSKEMLNTLLQQTFSPIEPALKLKTLQLLNRLCQKVEFYKLGCNMEQEAALVSYEAMCPKN